MKECPVCHAKIEENARFCIHCMSELEKKKTVTVLRKNSKCYDFILAALSLIIVSSITGVIALASKLPEHTPTGDDPPDRNNCVISTAPNPVKTDTAPHSESTTDINREEPHSPIEDHAELYTFDKETGTLTLLGTGAMQNYTYESGAPWEPYKKSIKKVVCSPGLTSIGDYAFFDCVNLTEIILPEGITSIGNSAFKYCYKLTACPLPDTVKEIGGYAFCYCTKLTDITVPDGIASIEEYTFYGCSELTEITVPKSVTAINNSAFYNCIKLDKIRVDSANTVYHAENNCLIETATKELILGCKSSVIPSDGSVTAIKNDAFHGCVGLTDLSLPDSIVFIGDAAFYSCIQLTEIVLPKGIKTIGNSTFYRCSSLTDLSLPNGVTSIGEYAFYGCWNLEEIVLPDGITVIPEYAFYGCKSLKEILLPQGVTTVCKRAFYACNNSRKITLPQSITTIESEAFYGCFESKVLYNYSPLSISKNSRDYGYVGYYAENIYH